MLKGRWDQVGLDCFVFFSKSNRLKAAVCVSFCSSSIKISLEHFSATDFQRNQEVDK